MIKIEDCKHGYLYVVDARNFSLGVYNSEKKWFKGLRLKFDLFLDEEDHWDHDHGTAKPIREVEKCPDEILADHKLLFSWMEAKEKELGAQAYKECCDARGYE